MLCMKLKGFLVKWPKFGPFFGKKNVLFFKFYYKMIEFINFKYMFVNLCT